MKLKNPTPYTGAEARVELADEVERRNLWLTNRLRTRKIKTPIRLPRFAVKTWRHVYKLSLIHI